jgi:hypothetical protein
MSAAAEQVISVPLPVSRSDVLYLKLKGEKLAIKDSYLQGAQRKRFLKFLYQCQYDPIQGLSSMNCIRRAGGKSDPYFEVRKAHGTVWSKEGGTFAQVPYKPPVPGVYFGTINSKSGKGDISLVARSNIIRNSLDPDWLTVKIPLSRCRQRSCLRMCRRVFFFFGSIRTSMM